MQYIIMLLIVVGLALADFLTGFIKAYCQGNVRSAKMRKGGLNKIGEVIVMATVCGLDIGIGQLGRYAGGQQLAGITGLVTSSAVFGYIVIMEIISILENFAEINPQAKWIARFLKRLKNDNDKEE